MRVVLSWSGGKDAALALEELGHDHEVVELLTTVSKGTGRTTMHGVRPELIRRQAEAVDRPVRLVELPGDASNDAYERRMREVTNEYAHLDAVAFADLHLEDVRAYREARLADAPITGCWPVWGRDTDAFLRDFLDRGYEAIVVCANDKLGPEFAGRRIDDTFRDALPPDVDPCGEHGEFHTFVTDGPPFTARVAVERGGLVSRTVGSRDETYHYRDLRPA